MPVFCATSHRLLTTVSSAATLKCLFYVQVNLSSFKTNFFCRRYGTKCSGCGQGIAPSDLVRKPRDKVFHLNCFTCCICRKQLSTGEQLYVLDDNKFICKDDYMLGKGSHHHMTGELEIAASSFYNPLIKRRIGKQTEL